MADMQEFPENWEDFIKMHEFDDSAEVYTNGVLLVPSFRVGQMVEHYFKERTCERITLGLEREREVATVSWICSACRKHMNKDHNYCPNCGAKVVSEVVNE